MSRSDAPATASQAVQNMLMRAAGVAALFGYPNSWERREIDENQSLWASYTPDYAANPSLRKDISADLCIIGGGFTGVSTAYHFSQRYPDKRIVLLEAKKLANGASGRNGGMMLNWVNGIDDHSDAMTTRIYETTNAAIDMIVGIIDRHNLDVSFRRDGSMTAFTDPARADNAARYAERLQSLGIPMQFLSGDDLRKSVDLQGVYGATLDPNEGQINGAQLIRAMKPVLVERGVEIYENTPVTRIQEGEIITVSTADAEVKAAAIVLATNAYTGKLGYFRKAVFPLHSHVFATAPLSEEQRAAIGWRAYSGYSDDLDRISYSSMTREGHMVFGGGSNRSYDYLFNNRTAYPGTAQKAFDAMRATMLEYLPSAADLPITHRWTGTLAISLHRNCSIGVRGDHRNVYYGLGYSGHGVTLANLAGKIITDIYSGDNGAWRDLPFINAGFASVPLEPFRWIGYQAMTRLTGKSPRV
jgi:glycine/D-amino acid oxidase-like deaminating enzyme